MLYEEECTIGCRGCSECLPIQLLEMPIGSTSDAFPKHVRVQRNALDSFSIYAYDSDYSNRPLSATVTILLAYATE